MVDCVKAHGTVGRYQPLGTIIRQCKTTAMSGFPRLQALGPYLAGDSYKYPGPLAQLSTFLFLHRNGEKGYVRQDNLCHNCHVWVS